MVKFQILIGATNTATAAISIPNRISYIFRDTHSVTFLGGNDVENSAFGDKFIKCFTLYHSLSFLSIYCILD